MGAMHEVVVGRQGELIVPADACERAGIREGTVLVMVETPSGLVLLTREQLRGRVRDDLEGTDLVASLLAERRSKAAAGGTA